MALSKRYANLKLKAGSFVNPETGSVGPQTLTAATTYSSSAVPCKGATMVVFKVLSTNANLPQSHAANVDNIAAVRLFRSVGFNQDHRTSYFEPDPS